MFKQVFSAKIIEIGKELIDRNSSFLILYGNLAPQGLRDYCMILDNHQLARPLEVGDYVMISSEKFVITSLGSRANEQLTAIGHVTLHFNGARAAEQSGSIYLEKKNKPIVSVGTEIIFYKNKAY